MAAPATATPAPVAGGAVQTLRFITYAKERPTEEFRKMEPFQRHLETILRERGYRIKVDLQIFSTYEEAQDAVVEGDYDFGRLGPASYLLVRERKAPVRLLVCESYHGSDLFEGSIFVREDSPIRRLSEVRGKRFAFGDDKSTTGRYLPQALLVREGIKAGDLAAFDYLGRHDKVVLSVASGQFDVGAANDRTLDKLKDRHLRKIASVTTPTEAWVINTRVDAKLAEALRKALLTVDRTALRYLDRDGFLPCSEAGYETLRREMRFADQFGG